MHHISEQNRSSNYENTEFQKLKSLIISLAETLQNTSKTEIKVN